MIKLIDLLREIRVNNPIEALKLTVKRDHEDPEGHWYEVYFILDKNQQKFKNRFKSKKDLLGNFDEDLKIYDVPDNLFLFLDKYKIPYKKLSKYQIEIPKESIKIID